MQKHHPVKILSAYLRSHTLGSLVIPCCNHCHLHNPFTSTTPVVRIPVPSPPPLPILSSPTPPFNCQSLFHHVFQLCFSTNFDGGSRGGRPRCWPILIIVRRE